ncbi:hypothetical protein DFH11DRAFT_1747576 [Phellopilus nigrolimitatus]|nr:hypothetical protein DFH11DRAFT_1747576 [Phellopilus nigrolimitatus]
MHFKESSLKEFDNFSVYLVFTGKKEETKIMSIITTCEPCYPLFISDTLAARQTTIRSMESNEFILSTGTTARFHSAIKFRKCKEVNRMDIMSFNIDIMEDIGKSEEWYAAWLKKVNTFLGRNVSVKELEEAIKRASADEPAEVILEL